MAILVYFFSSLDTVLFFFCFLMTCSRCSRRAVSMVGVHMLCMSFGVIIRLALPMLSTHGASARPALDASMSYPLRAEARVLEKAS